MSKGIIKNESLLNKQEYKGKNWEVGNHRNSPDLAQAFPIEMVD